MNKNSTLDYHIFRTIKHTSPQIWEGNGGVSYSLNVAYLACGGWGRQRNRVLSPYFPPLKPRYVLWSSVSYNPKNTVIMKDIMAKNKNCFIEKAVSNQLY